MLRPTVLRLVAVTTATIWCAVAGPRAVGQAAAQPQVQRQIQPPIEPLSPLIEELHPFRAVLDATGFTGTTVIYDLKRNHWSGVHTETADRRRIPASTYKILNAMIALETRAVASDAAVLRWDGVVRDRIEINQDLSLSEAFRLSAVPHFQALARAIGSERMQEWVQRVGYGNEDISGGIDQFWLTGGLRISPREQIQLLVRLYRSQLPFAERTMRIARMIMETERTPAFVVRAKTGLALLPEGRVGWWVGWVERGEDVFFFATVLEHPSDAPTFLAARIDVTKALLGALHAFDQR